MVIPPRDEFSKEYRILLSEEAAVRFRKMLQPKYRKQFDGWMGYNDAAEVFHEQNSVAVVSQ